MVKGISRRIVVVPSPDPRVFEQAIFVVREDFVGERGLSEKEILRQARQAAEGYLRGQGRPGLVGARLRAALYAAAGAACAALAWLAAHVAGILV